MKTPKITKLPTMAPEWRTGGLHIVLKEREIGRKLTPEEKEEVIRLVRGQPAQREA